MVRLAGRVHHGGTTPELTVEFSPLLAALIAFGISSIMSVGGISGAFLLLPFQVSVLGFTGPAVTPTNHLYNVVAIPSGVWRYLREGRMLWPLTTIIVMGTVPGVIAGSLLRLWLLPDPRHFKLFVGCVLLFIGSRVAAKVLRPPAQVTAPAGRFVVEVTRFDLQKLEYRFQDTVHGVSVPRLALLTAVIGVIGGAYGIGGGAIIAPVLVSVWGLPVHTIAGACLFGTFVTSTVGVAFFWVLSVAFGVASAMPDWALGLSFGVGGLLGTYTGARLQRWIPARAIESLLALVVSGLGLSYALGFVLAR
ncbi:MAG: sulfite exporter TauE/SafE family protein [Pseudomonadota bacterium]